MKGALVTFSGLESSTFPEDFLIVLVNTLVDVVGGLDRASLIRSSSFRLLFTDDLDKLSFRLAMLELR